jgi:two-component system chemotaxis response regulator CheB
VTHHKPAPAADGWLPLIAVGGSAGSLGPLISLVRGLPADLAATVVVTIHIGEQSRSQLASILSRSGPLPARRAEEGATLRPGRIYVAPPGRHLLVVDGRAHLSAGPRVNRHRPAVDVMFASVATSARARSLAVVLSGVLDDGAVGAALVAGTGGRVLVQDPGEAEFSGMPAAALAAAPGALAARSAELATSVLKLVHAQSEAAAGAHARESIDEEHDMWMADSDDPGFLSTEETRLTRLVCPECGGSLAEVQLPQISYFRCHVGHQYGPQTLAAAQAEAVEAKLWSAVAALEEQAAFQRYLGRTAAAVPEATAESAAEPSTGSAADENRAQAIAARAVALREQVRQWTSQMEPSPGSAPPSTDAPLD